MNPPPERARRTAGFVAVLAAVSVWAGWLPVTRLAVVTRLRPEDVAALRFGVAGLLLAPVLALRWREVPWRRPLWLVPLLAGAGVPYQLLFGHGLAIANSGEAAVLGPGLVSSLVAVLALVLLGERLTRAQVAGLLVTLAGVGGVLAHDLVAGGGHFAGYAFIVAGSASWATYTVSSRALRLPPLVNAAAVSVVNALCYLPLYVAGGGGARLAAVPARDLLLQGLYQGVATAVLALIAFAFAVQRLGAAAAASFMPLVPVLATFYGWLLLGDRVDGATAAGLLAVAAGVLIVNRRALWALFQRDHAAGDARPGGAGGLAGEVVAVAVDDERPPGD